MPDDLTIEVTGSAEKAASALDKIIQKITDLQERFDKAAPSVSKFAAQMEQIASSSKSFQAFQKMAGGLDKQAVASKNAESKMAMYQARLDRANVSMDRSRVQSEKLAASLGKVSEAQRIAANNSAAFSMSPEDFAAKYNHSGNGGVDLTPQTSEGAEAGPAPVNAPVEKFDVSKIQANIDSMKPKINIDADSAMAELQRMGEYIDSLRPRISGMSEEAQAQFNALAAKLELVSRQIDNQRNAYQGLQSAALKAEQEQGNGSDAYLKLEKRILSADAASQRLAATQEKLKAELAGVASGAAAAGEQSERAARRSTSGWQKTFDMFGRMLIRIAAFKIYSAIAQGITTGIQNMAQADSKANSTMSQLATSVQYLQNSIAAALMPVLEALTPVIVQVADAISWAANQLAIFIAQVTGQKTVTIATKSYVDYAKSLNKAGDNADSASKKVKELQRTIMGFDELNVLQKNVDAVGGSKVNTPDYGSMFKTIPTPAASEAAKNVQKAFDWLKDGADKGGKAIDRLREKVKGLENEFSKVKAPVIPPIRVSAWNMGAYDRSKKKYQSPVAAPSFAPVLAPAIILADFLASRARYLQNIPAPAIERPVAPAIDLERSFFPSLNSAKNGLTDWETETQQSVSKWKTAMESNFATVFAYYKSVVIASNPQVKVEIDKGFSADLKSSANWGTAFMRNLRSVAVFISTVFPSPLKAANDAFNSFFSVSNKNSIRWGNAIVGVFASAVQTMYDNLVSSLKAQLVVFAAAARTMGKNIVGTLVSHGPTINKVLNAAPFAAGALGMIAAGAAAIPAIAPMIAALAFDKGGIVTAPTVGLIGEGKDNEAIIPLNPSTFSQIARGIKENSGSASPTDFTPILQRMDKLEKAISEMQIFLYTDDKKLADSVHKGERLLGRTAPTRQ